MSQAAVVAAAASGGEKEAALQGWLKKVEGLLAVEAAGRADAPCFFCSADSQDVHEKEIGSPSSSLFSSTPAFVSKTPSSLFGLILDRLKTDPFVFADTQAVHLERDERGLGLIMDLGHFDGLGVN